MDENKKKIVMIATIVICLALAVVISVVNFGGGSGSSGTGQVTLKCDSCGAAEEVSSEEYRELINSSGAQRNMAMLMGPVAVKCSKCGQQSAYQAMRCPKCKEAFVPGDAGDQNYMDKCPKCGYSAMKEQVNMVK